MAELAGITLILTALAYAVMVFGLTAFFPGRSLPLAVRAGIAVLIAAEAFTKYRAGSELLRGFDPGELLSDVGLALTFGRFVVAWALVIGMAVYRLRGERVR